VEPIGDYPNPEWHLIDIIVESGPRCANFSSTFSIVMSPPDEPVTRDQYLELIARIEDLEYRVYCDDSE
jgi:hypothetical protein